MHKLDAQNPQGECLWVPPQITELDIKTQTQGGYFNTHWEGPWNVFFNDSKNDSGS